MENVKIISDNGIETNVSGLFYVFNSKYYFIYTLGEIDENEYIKLYVVQVCKEVQNTPTGPVDTGYMLGMEISNSEEWETVQKSITRIVEDKKNETQSTEIHYLPISMLVNLKIVSKNKFKLMRYIVENNFKVTISSQSIPNVSNNQNDEFNSNFEKPTTQPIVENVLPNQNINSGSISNISDNTGEVIIDYRTRFFEEQEKTQVLENEIKILKEKLNDIKNIIG